MSNNINEKQLKGRFYCTVRSLDTNIHKTYQQKYEFLKNEFINNEKFSENESQYLLNMLLKDYFYESTQSKSTKNCGSNQERYASLKKEFANYKKFTENERQCILNMLLRDYYFDTAWSMKSSVYRTYQQKYEFFKTQFDNNENLEIHEKQYLFNMLQKRFDNLSVINNDGEKRHCENCKSATYALQYCEFCVRDYLQKSYRKWTGNDEIDNAIKKAQERAMGPNLIIEFIPNEKLKINPNHIAEGGYAKIYKAVWIDGPFDVWNKEEKVLERTKDYNVILKKLKGSNKSTGNWINEIISHFTIDKIATNIVRCHGLTKDRDSGDFSLVLDVMDFNLQEYMTNNSSRIGWKERYQIVYKISHCLYAIHDAKSVHRDLHPGNILFHENFIRISDLGFCGQEDKPLDDVYGCLPYIAPEVLCKKPNHYTTKADIYSLGIIMWMISTGIPPFYGQKHDIYLANAILVGLRPEIAYGTPPEYVALMKQCWDAVPEQRPEASTIFKKLYSLCKSFTNHEECPENFTGAGMQFPDDISSGEGPGAFLRSRIQFSDVISSGEGPGPFLNSRIYSFLNLAEPSNFAKVVLDKIRECDFDNVIELFDTDSSDFGFEKVDNTVESLESLRYHDNTDEEYVTISKKSQQKDSSQESVNENYNNDEMTSIVDLLFLIFSKLHNEGFNEVKINKKINKYIAINGKTPNSVFIWLCNNKAMSKQTCLLGRFYHGGIGTDMNKERAFYTFLNVEENAGKNEAGIAQFYLGYYYYNGIAIKADIDKAFMYYLKSTMAGNPNGQCRLGRCYENGNGTLKDEKKAFDWYLMSARGQNTWGQFYLGRCYKNGIGVVKNQKEALKWYSIFVKSGIFKVANTSSKVESENSPVIPISLNESDSSRQICTNITNPSKIFWHGYCYEHGIETEKDEYKAFLHYLKSADMGDSNGMFQVGNCYHLGIGVKIDKRMAFNYYEKSANMGNTKGILKTMICYFFGIGVAKDKEKAKNLLNREDILDFDRFLFAARDAAYGKCKHCNEYNTNKAWCLTCDPDIETQKWTSGTFDIDNCIKEFQLKTTAYEYMVEWIPFDRLDNVVEIGRGGFGSVYSATWLEGIRKIDGIDLNYIRARENTYKVALKTISAVEKDSIAFLNEFKNCMKCILPGRGLQTYGLTRRNNEFLMVFQYADGGNIRTFLRTKFHELTWKFKLKQLLDISRDLLRIHKAGYIHADFHSGNILQDKENTYVSDLGLSIQKNERMDGIYGVLPYVAPEVLLGKQFTQQSDIYGLGVIMAEISTGQRPFDGYQFDENLAVHICTGLRPNFAPGTPQCYIDLAMKCMDLVPEERPSAHKVYGKFIEWHDMLQSANNTSEIKNQFLAADKIIKTIPPISQFSKDKSEIKTLPLISQNLIDEIRNETLETDEIIESLSYFFQNFNDDASEMKNEFLADNKIIETKQKHSDDMYISKLISTQKILKTVTMFICVSKNLSKHPSKHLSKHPSKPIQVDNINIPSNYDLGL